MYEGVYINLDRAVQRRETLERQLAQAGLSKRYTRFAAIDGNSICYGPEALPGSSALGCTLSHLSVIKAYHDPSRHLHILEDDALLHPEIPRVLDAFLSQRDAEEWDLLMTDLFLPPDVYLFKHLHAMYLASRRDGSINFLDVAKWDFAGANSYFINGRSKERFLQLAEHSFPAHTPYDLRIRSLAREGMLKVYACFPFFSTLAPTSSDSTIAGDFRHVLPLTEYRRSFYVDPDLEAINRDLAAFPSEPDLHTEIYLGLLRALADPRHNRF